jgi:hypothetical protein
MLAERCDLFVRYRGRRARQRGRIVEDLLLQQRECRARCVIGEAAKLILGDAFFSADGRVDIQSEYTADQ